MLKPKRLFLYRLLTCLMPETSCFALKRSLLRFAGAKIGDNVRICSSATILGAGELSIGSGTWIGQKVLIIASGSVSIGSNVDVAPFVYVGDGSHEVDFDGVRCAGNGISGKIVIGDGVWLCARSTVLPGITVGEMSVIGACALVNKSVPSRVIAAGVPAKVIKTASDGK